MWTWNIVISLFHLARHTVWCVCNYCVVLLLLLPEPRYAFMPTRKYQSARLPSLKWIRVKWEGKKESATQRWTTMFSFIEYVRLSYTWNVEAIAFTFACALCLVTNQPQIHDDDAHLNGIITQISYNSKNNKTWTRSIHFSSITYATIRWKTCSL